jgi:hypothetical protein
MELKRDNLFHWLVAALLVVMLVPAGVVSFAYVISVLSELMP